MKLHWSVMVVASVCVASLTVGVLYAKVPAEALAVAVGGLLLWLAPSPAKKDPPQ